MYLKLSWNKELEVLTHTHTLTHTLFLFPHLFPHTELFPTAQHHVEERDYPSQGYVYLFSEMH